MTKKKVLKQKSATVREGMGGGRRWWTVLYGYYSDMKKYRRSPKSMDVTAIGGEPMSTDNDKCIITPN